MYVKQVQAIATSIDEQEQQAGVKRLALLEQIRAGENEQMDKGSDLCAQARALHILFILLRLVGHWQSFII